jgi:hypothetical protein
MSQMSFLTARQVMARYGISKNTVYCGPLRLLAVSVGRTRGLRWPVQRLEEWETGNRAGRAAGRRHVVYRVGDVRARVAGHSRDQEP